MTNKFYFVLALGLGLASMVFTVEATERDPVEAVLLKERTFPSGFSTPEGCEVSLLALSDSALAATLMPPVRFTQATPARKIANLHTIADLWYRVFVRAQDMRYFESEFGRQQLNTFLRRVRALRAVPIMKLRPFAHELLVMGAKIEHLTARSRQFPEEYIAILRGLIYTTGRLPVEDTPENHALRSINRAQYSHLLIALPMVKVGETKRAIHEGTPERRGALAEALEALKDSVEEDTAGLNWYRFAHYSGSLLPYFIADYVAAAPDERSFVARELDEIVEILHQGVRHLMLTNSLSARQQLDHVVAQMNIIVHHNRDLTNQVPGLRERLDRLVDQIALPRRAF